mmetsp:Transcript_37626/g.110201  ORF Transcript_37626/g.110201 Transcript_37626/m.110201 type:complete len:226 (+) Transcript_37626:125-802(+)
MLLDQMHRPVVEDRLQSVQRLGLDHSQSLFSAQRRATCNEKQDRDRAACSFEDFEQTPGASENVGCQDDDDSLGHENTLLENGVEIGQFGRVEEDERSRHRALENVVEISRIHPCLDLVVAEKTRIRLAGSIVHTMCLLPIASGLLPCRRERNLLVSLVTGSCMLDAVVRSKDLDDAKSTEQSDEGEVLKVGQQRYYERANDGDGIDNVQDALGHVVLPHDGELH